MRLQGAATVGPLHLGQVFADGERDGLEFRTAGAVEVNLALSQQFMEPATHQALQECELVVVVVVESGPVNSGLLRYILHRDLVEALGFE